MRERGVRINHMINPVDIDRSECKQLHFECNIDNSGKRRNNQIPGEQYGCLDYSVIVVGCFLVCCCLVVVSVLLLFVPSEEKEQTEARGGRAPLIGDGRHRERSGR